MTSRIVSRLTTLGVIVLTTALAVIGPVGAPCAAAQTRVSEKPYVIDYYYKAKWGYAAEWLRLFKKNHYPVLKKDIEAGRIVSVTVAAPRYHGSEDGRWDYRVTITFKNVVAAHDADPVAAAAVLKQLYPDQTTFEQQEQRRFEILEAHWDVPMTAVDVEGK